MQEMVLVLFLRSMLQEKVFIVNSLAKNHACPKSVIESHDQGHRAKTGCLAG